VAAACIGVLSEPGDIILDPFLGSGTTIVEAQRLDRVSVGFDINPISCKISRAKTLELPATRIGRMVVALKNKAEELLQPRFDSRFSDPVIPVTVQAKWYTERVRQHLGLLWGLVTSSRGSSRILAESAFSATLLPVCRETRHWGYVCDNSTPKGQHEGSPILEFCRILDRIRRAYDERDRDRRIRPNSREKLAGSTICCGDSRHLLSTIPDNSIDLIITSPPYYGVSDYVKSQRLSAEWFGIEIEPLRLSEIGARSKRHRQKSGVDYISELHVVFEQAFRCLKPNCACVVIIGESVKRKSVVPSFIRDILGIGFKKVLQRKRHVSQQRRQLAVIETETILVLRS
jgi:hypothetical protein